MICRSSPFDYFLGSVREGRGTLFEDRAELFRPG